MATKVVWLLLVVAGCRTPIELPRSTTGEPRDARTWPSVSLTNAGEVLYRGKAVTLKELEERLVPERGEPEDERLHRIGLAFPATRRPILLRIDRRAPATHASWLMRAVGDAGFHRIHVAVRGPDGPAVVAMRIMSDFYLQPLPKAMEDLGASIRPRDVGVVEWFLDDSGDFPKELSDVLDGVRKKWSRDGLAQLQVRSRTPFADVVEAYDTAHANGYRYVEWGHEVRHPWVVTQRRLPPLGDDDYVIRPDGHTMKDTTWLRLALAPDAAIDRDDDPDDRLILNLDDKGRLLYRERPRSLDEIATIVANAKRVYNLKQRAKGKSGEDSLPGGRASKLFVLLRIDKEAPWQHIAWLLAALDCELLYKIQLAALVTADARWDPAECRLLGAAPNGRFPTRPGGLDGKLNFSLLRPSGGSTLTILAGRYRLADRKTTDPLELGRWLQNGTAPVLISPGPRVPHKFVVAAANQVRRAGRTFFFDYGVLPGRRILARRTLPAPR